jgi:hypothetical protein
MDLLNERAECETLSQFDEGAVLTACFARPLTSLRALELPEGFAKKRGDNDAQRT